MLPLLFCEQGATAPVGNFGGITITQATTKWIGTAWFGGKMLAMHTASSRLNALQRSLSTLVGYIAGPLT